MIQKQAKFKFTITNNQQLRWLVAFCVYIKTQPPEVDAHGIDHTGIEVFVDETAGQVSVNIRDPYSEYTHCTFREFRARHHADMVSEKFKGVIVQAPDRDEHERFTNLLESRGLVAYSDETLDFARYPAVTFDRASFRSIHRIEKPHYQGAVTGHTKAITPLEFARRLLAWEKFDIATEFPKIYGFEGKLDPDNTDLVRYDNITLSVAQLEHILGDFGNTTPIARITFPSAISLDHKVLQQIVDVARQKRGD